MTNGQFIMGIKFRVKNHSSLQWVYRYDLPEKQLLDLEWGKHLEIREITESYFILSSNKEEKVYYGDLIEVSA